MPTHALGRKYDLIDVGDVQTAAAFGQTGKSAGQTEKSVGDSESLQMERSRLLGTQMPELVTLRP